ncbi:tail fiber [Salmonella phage vB_Si_DR094]|uniref:Tail fiber n=1 Tax=Salmonella phage vB_Si_DR094 TaxID=2859525 RepID=A0AAE7X9M2_9CAUD|nr:tail fiber [Salmonella phage vB_Si_DR094]
MADYKLSELNSIDTIRSDDLLHVRVKKRPEMLGDEDRRMTYQDFLASFKLERFVQIAGSTMTGDLGIVKLLYGGKAVFDPTGSSEITIGDVLKTFKLNANGLKLTIADASRSATVYHTLNKPSPNELGMRTNEENDARYAKLANSNTFKAKQTITSNGEILTLVTPAEASSAYCALVGRDASNEKNWAIGNLIRGSFDVQIESRQGSILTLGTTVTINKTLAVVGQVKPSDFSNLDARYFTQTVANQRFAQLAGNNTFSGYNTFNQLSVFKKDGEAIRLQNANAAQPLYIKAIDSAGVNRWYIGNSNEGDNVALENYKTSGKITVGTSVNINKTLTVTGQVQPSDWANIDSRYIPAATLSTIARTNATNTFSGTQNIQSDGNALRLRNKIANNAQYIEGVNLDGSARWWVGIGSNGADAVNLYNNKYNSALTVASNISVNKSLAITGQVQPSDFSNLDARYFTQSASDSRYLRIRSTNFNNGNDEKWAKIATVVMPQPASTAVIEVFGGAGFNYGVLDQACKTEIVLRTGNERPKGLNIVAWKNSENPIITDIGSVNTSGDTYDIYCKVGSFQNATTSRVQSTSNAGVQLFEVPQTFDDAPQGIVKGTIAKYYTSMQKPTPSDIGAYTKAETDQKIAQAVSDSTDLNKIYPVGIVTWFNSNVNPNTALPGLTWTYLNNGVGRTIRIAAANGSDVATTGGSDSVTLAVGNLPSHTHSFSATTSSFDYGTKTTNTTGAHTHSVSGSTNNTGAHTHTVGGHYGGDSIGGKQRVQVSGTQQVSSSAGAHSHTVSGTAASNGNHAHTVGIGAHSHTVSGNTGGTGSGSAFSVTNQFYKLMAWVRTA